MKIFISDKLFSIKNITGVNNILISKLIETNCKNLTLYFIENVSKKYDLFDYLIETNIFNHYYWKEHLKSLSDYKVIVISKELLNQELSLYNENDSIYYYCEKRNINYNEFHKSKKYLYLYDYDNIDNTDTVFFTKIYTFNNIQASEDNIEFIRFNVKNEGLFTLFDNENKENIRKKFNISNDYIIIFIHLYDTDVFDTIDRIILSIVELRKYYKIYTIVYWPIQKNITQIITKNDLIFENDKYHFSFYKSIVPLEGELSNLNNDDKYNINFQTSIGYSINNRCDVENMLKTYLINDYKFSVNIDDVELTQNMYMSDIYIPITDEISYLTLLSQYYKTYTIFINDSYNTQEYCIFGDIPLLKSNDYIYSLISNRLKRNLRLDDVKESIENYIKNKDNSFFLYKREFCEYLFG